MTAARPRMVVIQHAWEELGIDAPAFVGRSGQLLARTVKCLIDPLVLRPRLHRHLAAALLDDDDADDVRALLTEAAPALHAASLWFNELRRTRRQLGITTGNIQELYFPRAFELATHHGPPVHDIEDMCRETLAEVHDQSLPTMADLLRHVNDPAVADTLQNLLAAGWDRDGSAPDLDRLANAVVEVCRETPGAWDDLLSLDDPYDLGIALRTIPGLTVDWLRRTGAPVQSVALASSDPMRPPALTADDEHLPLDRPVVARMRAALRRYRSDSEFIPIDELAEDETRRASESWGLQDPVLGAVFVVGVALAARLSPLDDPSFPDRPMSLATRCQAQVRKEAYVLRLRRLLTADGAIHPAQRRIVEDLRTFNRPYLRRLWVRLHGWDVLGTRPVDQEDVVDLLTGIARSVSLDHRQAIRGSLEQGAA